MLSTQRSDSLRQGIGLVQAQLDIFIESDWLTRRRHFTYTSNPYWVLGERLDPVWIQQAA